MQEIERKHERDRAGQQALKSASDGENLDGVNDGDIPDYIMRDFGPSEEPGEKTESR